VDHKTKALYPRNWPEISKATIMARGDRCERCGCTRDTAILTTHHKDHNPANNDDSNLEALCQACHLDMEKAYLNFQKKEAKIKAGQLVLLEWEQN